VRRRAPAELHRRDRRPAVRARQARDVPLLRHRRVPGGDRSGPRHPALARSGGRPARGPRRRRRRRRTHRRHPAVRRGLRRRAGVDDGALLDPGRGRRMSFDMSPNIVLVVVIGVLFAAGVYLLLERSLSRVLLGVLIISNGANLLFLVAGGNAGRAPIVGSTDPAEMSDPLPQAMVLTAIVITLGIAAFVLSMAYRSWQQIGRAHV